MPSSRQFFAEGLDPTGLACISTADLLQMFRAGYPVDPFGLFIKSASTPDVATYPELARFNWLNSTNGELKYYTGVAWDLVKASFNIPDGSIGYAKLVGSGTPNSLFKIGADGTTVTEITIASLFAAGSISLSTLANISALKVLGSIAGGAVSQLDFVDVFNNSIPDITLGSIPVDTLSVGTSGQILGLVGGVTAWTTPTYAFADNSIPQSKIKTQTTTLTCAATVTVDASVGDNFLLTLTSNVTTLSITNLVEGKSIQIKIKQDGTGSRTVGFSGIVWPSATAPTITTTAGHADIISVSNFAGTINGVFVQDYAS